jgi:hypothetical protein
MSDRSRLQVKLLGIAVAHALSCARERDPPGKAPAIRPTGAASTPNTDELDRPINQAWLAARSPNPSATYGRNECYENP